MASKESPGGRETNHDVNRSFEILTPASINHNDVSSPHVESTQSGEGERFHSPQFIIKSLNNVKSRKPHFHCSQKDLTLVNKPWSDKPIYRRSIQLPIGQQQQSLSSPPSPQPASKSPTRPPPPPPLTLMSSQKAKTDLRRSLSTTPKVVRQQLKKKPTISSKANFNSTVKSTNGITSDHHRLDRYINHNDQRPSSVAGNHGDRLVVRQFKLVVKGRDDSRAYSSTIASRNRSSLIGAGVGIVGQHRTASTPRIIASRRTTSPIKPCDSVGVGCGEGVKLTRSPSTNRNLITNAVSSVSTARHVSSSILIPG